MYTTQSSKTRSRTISEKVYTFSSLLRKSEFGVQCIYRGGARPPKETSPRLQHNKPNQNFNLYEGGLDNTEQQRNSQRRKNKDYQLAIQQKM